MRLAVRTFRAMVMALVLLAGGEARAAAPAALQIYFIDVEGGQATLVVTPRGETLLVDAGFAGEGLIGSMRGADPGKARDPGRILAAMRDAGVDRIDYLMVTHFHRDHIGGIPELAELVPVGAYIDYGSAYPAGQRARADTDQLDVAAYDAYLAVRARGRHIRPRPGDEIPLRGIRATIVSTDRSTLRQPLLQMLRQAAGVDSWQLHVSAEGGAGNAPAEQIANLEDTAHWLKVVASTDGSFTLTNGRTGLTRVYGRR